MLRPSLIRREFSHGPQLLASGRPNGDLLRETIVRNEVRIGLHRPDNEEILAAWGWLHSLVNTGLTKIFPSARVRGHKCRLRGQVVVVEDLIMRILQKVLVRARRGRFGA